MKVISKYSNFILILILSCNAQCEFKEKVITEVFPNGLPKQILYKRDSLDLDRIVFLHNNGSIDCRYFVDKHRRIQGKREEFFRSGELKKIAFFKDGVLSGPFYYKDSIGDFTIGEFKDNKYQGEIIDFNKKDSTVFRRIFNNGVLNTQFLISKDSNIVRSLFYPEIKFDEPFNNVVSLQYIFSSKVSYEDTLQTYVAITSMEEEEKSLVDMLIFHKKGEIIVDLDCPDTGFFKLWIRTISKTNYKGEDFEGVSVVFDTLYCE